MKSRLLLYVMLAVAAAAKANAAMITVRNVGGGMPNQIDVAPNMPGTFQVGIRIDLDPLDELNGLSFRMRSRDINDAFSITGRTITGIVMAPTGALNIPISTLAEITAAPGNKLSPLNAKDMGLIGPTGSSLVGSGTIMLVDFAYIALMPGDYRISACACATYNDTTFTDYDLEHGPDYIVHVTPEPATVSLLLLAATAFARRRIHAF